jgi:hypothetical protein
VATPSNTVRSTPTGRRIPDGFVTKIAFASTPALSLWEVKVKPPDYDGGEMIDITTMHNVKVHTMYPQSLYKNGDGTMMCGIDPDVIATIQSRINKPDSFTVWYPDSSSEDYFGVIRKLEWPELSIGEFPIVTVTFSPMDYDATANVEQASVFTAASGT